MVPLGVTDQFNVSGEPALLLTRLAPPAQPARLLRRTRVEHLLAAAFEHPLCLVIAPAGSGKTTALAALVSHGGWPVAWCRARADDDGPRLIHYLTAAFRSITRIDEEAITVLAYAGNLQAAVELLVNELAAGLDDETLLVIDDYHLADRWPELRSIVEHLIAAQPLRLHIALSGRVEPTLAGLSRLRLRGELLSIAPADLAFDAEESRTLFVRSGQEPPANLDELTAMLRGWPLGIQAMLGDQALRLVSFDGYLDDEVLAQLPENLRDFALRSAGLRWLDPVAAAVLVDGAEARIEDLRRHRLFLENDAAGHLCFQPLFHDYLSRHAGRDLPDWADLQRRLAAHYRSQGDAEGVLHHLVIVGDTSAAAALAEFAPGMIGDGRSDEVLSWAMHLRQICGAQPELLEIEAAALRHLGRFANALERFGMAEQAYSASGDLAGKVRALRGQAEVYLDTVQPAPATDLLKRALKLLPRDQTAERAELIRLQGENWANRGRADVALILERSARRLEESAPKPVGSKARVSTEGSPQPLHLLVQPSGLPPRLLLRAGRLDEAREQLEAQIWAENWSDTSGLVRPIAHREPLLLLSLIYAMLGSGTRALALARRALAESQQGGSRLTAAIAELRIGHAYQLVTSNDPGPAAQHYGIAMGLIQQEGVARTRAEAHLGMTLLYGHNGDLASADGEAREGLLIAAAAGDEWTAALIYLALGGAAAAQGDERALGWLEQAQKRFARGGDTYGQMMVTLWHGLYALRIGKVAEADIEISRLLEVVAERGYSGVLVGPNLFGPRDMATLVPLLLRGRGLPGHVEQARQLLRQGFPTIAADDVVEDYHPGFTLRVQMLGSFRVWRGNQEILAREWQREKARQLFQLLLTYRGHWIQREQICAWLWPDADLEAAERQFKVTLNALNAALEPNRPPRVQPFFIRRQGLAYSFAPSYGVWIDVDEFELRVAGAAAKDEPDFARRNAQIAVQLYRGDYLTESLYDLWTIEERERLIARYLTTAVDYAMRLTVDGDFAQAVQLCEQVLRRDRGYEEAYQVLMRAHARAGSRSQALRSYTRCVQALRDDLGIEPLPETVALVDALKRNEQI